MQAARACLSRGRRCREASASSRGCPSDDRGSAAGGERLGRADQARKSLHAGRGRHVAFTPPSQSAGYATRQLDDRAWTTREAPASAAESAPGAVAGAPSIGAARRRQKRPLRRGQAAEIRTRRAAERLPPRLARGSVESAARECRDQPARDARRVLRAGGSRLKDGHRSPSGAAGDGHRQGVRRYTARPTPVALAGFFARGRSPRWRRREVLPRALSVDASQAELPRSLSTRPSAGRRGLLSAGSRCAAIRGHARRRGTTGRRGRPRWCCSKRSASAQTPSGTSDAITRVWPEPWRRPGGLVGVAPPSDVPSGANLRHRRRSSAQMLMAVVRCPRSSWTWMLDDAWLSISRAMRAASASVMPPPERSMEVVLHPADGIGASPPASGRTPRRAAKKSRVPGVKWRRRGHRDRRDRHDRPSLPRVSSWDPREVHRWDRPPRRRRAATRRVRARSARRG